MTTNANIRFEDWEAEQMKDPEFRAAIEELGPEYQAARGRIMRELIEEQLAQGKPVPRGVLLIGMRGPTADEIGRGKELEPLARECLADDG